MNEISSASPRRVAVVTGGSRGIGASITELLASSGVHVAVAFMSRTEVAERLRDRVAAAGGSISLHPGDIRDPKICSQLIDDVVAQQGYVDYLINNAGALVEDRVEDTTDAQWLKALEANLSSAFFLTRAALPGMARRGFGRIVYVSSVTALMGSPVEAAYGAAKAGLIGLTRSVARQVARDGVTVNCIVPGIFETEMTASMPVKSQEAIRRLIPMGRRGDPSELAHAVQFLVADQASYVTGSIITVDGGISMGG